MIKLDNLSKYYHNDGNVVLGLRKINLELKIGEFVAITGESGSGKSTLLNVISGLDTYEDGELYINNEETSYFDEVDWENYRRQYIGFVFQSYNLIDSYNVLENVEAALIIAGVGKEERRKKAIDILNRVGLGKHLKHKGTKLSGGEKQRLAIARAIAKDAPIIVADEPTGNLDSKTGEQIIELLHEISKEKLVIIVTHNYGLVEKYVTRKIRIYDGEVVENIEISKAEDNERVKPMNKEMPRYKKALIFSSLNLKNQPKRTAFMLLVTLVTTFIISLVFGQILLSEINANYSYGNNNIFFHNATPDRIVVKKKDNTPISVDDYNELIKLKNVNCIVKEDLVIDLSGYINLDYFNINGHITSLQKITEKDLIDGRMPENENEVVVTYNYNDQPLPYSGMLVVDTGNIGGFPFQKVKVVGVVESHYPYEIYLTNQLITKLNNLYQYYLDNHSLTITFPEELLTNPQTFEHIILAVDPKLKDNVISVSSRLLYGFDPMEINITAKISGCDKEFSISKLYKDDYSSYYTIMVSPNTYNENVANFTDYYQHSVYVKNVASINDTITSIKNLGYYAFCPYTASINRYFDIGIIISQIAIIIFSALVIFCIYLLSFVIIKTILNSKKRDYAILKSVGLDAKTIKISIVLEIVFAFIIAFILLMVAVILAKVNQVKFIKNLYEVYRWYDYIILFVINIVIGVLASLRYNRKMIEKSLVAQTKVE